MPPKPRIDPRIETARKVSVVSLDELTLWDKNPHTGDVSAIRSSLQRFGQVVPIVRAPDGWIISGNHTLKAMREEGFTHAAVVTKDGTSEDLIALGLAMNKIATMGADDNAALLSLLQELDGILDGTGFTDDDVNDLVAMLEEADRKEARNAPTSVRNDQGVARDEPSLPERLEGYANKAIRSIVIDLPLPAFAWWTEHAEAARVALGLESNTALIVHLLAAERNVPAPDLG